MSTPTQTPASPLSEERVREYEQMRARVAESREIRAAAGIETKERGGSYIYTSSVPADRPALARMVAFEFEYVRWANKTILTLCDRVAELEQESDECDALRITLADILTRTVNALRGTPPEHVSWSWHDIPDLAAALLADRTALTARLEAVTEKAAKYDRINTPELYDFVAAVENEALHQRERWGIEQDGDKSDADWFWLIGYLAGKALHNPAKDDMEPRDARLHRIITVAAAAANWHAAVLGAYPARS